MNTNNYPANHSIVSSLQPCPHCNTKPIDAYRDDSGGYLVFPRGGCMYCYGKTGILRVIPLTDSDRAAVKKFRQVDNRSVRDLITNNVCEKCGINNKHAVEYIPDGQFVCDSFGVDIDCEFLERKDLSVNAKKEHLLITCTVCGYWYRENTADHGK